MFAHGLEWLAREGRPAPGVRGLLALYVNPAFPQPLTLPGRVVAHRAGADGLWAQFEFEGLSPPVSELIEKLVFRHHRRQIAEARGAAAGH